MSAATTALLLALVVLGFDISLVRMDVAVADGAVSLHPTFVAWGDAGIALGWAFGNVAVCDRALRSAPYTPDDAVCVLSHELRHCEQFRALGWATWPAKFVLPIEPPDDFVRIQFEPLRELDVMWSPPPSWCPVWSFIMVTLPYHASANSANL